MMREEFTPEQENQCRRLESEVAILTNRFAAYFERYVYLSRQVERWLRHDYMTLIGEHELRLYEQTAETKRLQRYIDEARTYVERGLPVDCAAIERKLEREFQTLESEVEEKRDKVEQVREVVATREPMSDKQAATFKEDFRFITRHVHPAIVDDFDEEKQWALNQAIYAFTVGSFRLMHTLRLYWERQAEEPVPEEDFDTLVEDLRDRRERLHMGIFEYRAKMGELKHEFPFNQQRLLTDKEAVKARVTGILEETEKWRLLEKVLRGSLEMLIQREA